ncbi:hypothetical protein FB451DRAFT_1226855 [Mycena latifolia]|nr:hypothetical protein FB451DRAFT_1226855 [Mycena latifolia]
MSLVCRPRVPRTGSIAAILWSLDPLVHANPRGRVSRIELGWNYSSPLLAVPALECDASLYSCLSGLGPGREGNVIFSKKNPSLCSVSLSFLNLNIFTKILPNIPSAHHRASIRGHQAGGQVFSKRRNQRDHPLSIARALARDQNYTQRSARHARDWKIRFDISGPSTTSSEVPFTCKHSISVTRRRLASWYLPSEIEGHPMDCRPHHAAT